MSTMPTTQTAISTVMKLSPVITSTGSGTSVLWLSVLVDVSGPVFELLGEFLLRNTVLEAVT